MNYALIIEEVFWKDKARVQWNTDGDRNSKFFPRYVKIKNKTKTIDSEESGCFTTKIQNPFPT